MFIQIHSTDLKKNIVTSEFQNGYNPRGIARKLNGAFRLVRVKKFSICMGTFIQVILIVKSSHYRLNYESFSFIYILYPLLGHYHYYVKFKVHLAGGVNVCN